MARRQTDKTTRADQIRASRQYSPKKTVKPTITSSATRKQTKYKVPVTRRKTPPTPVISHNRQKVQVPLKSKGVELHLPAFPRLQLGWRFISGAIFFLSLAVVISLSSFDAFRVNAIELQGAQRLDSTALLSQLDVHGKSIISVIPEEVEAKIEESFPSLSSVRVSTGLPASVTIRVEERKPIILWQQEDTELWIDAEGVMFPVRGEAEVAMTVIANGEPPAAPTTGVDEEIITDQEITESDSLEAQLLAAYMLETPTYPRTTREFVQGVLSLSGHIPEGSFLQYDPQFGLGWQDPNGWMAYFGRDIANIEVKLAEYQTILAALKADGITPKLISVEYLHAPFYRLE